ncbi:hypothetical protein EVG20_g896 [Dentipellis fragilis]|uniref:Uncharacterized protein n=1 Tax=Dentipellis fragilis TaxID=205917 RepID=A0A4Y9ZE37_9AGAM|nr:hypothetical protein EVG20_g896 [Dentipellis fragilis]
MGLTWNATVELKQDVTSVTMTGRDGQTSHDQGALRLYDCPRQVTHCQTGSTLRSTIARPDTEVILSYYQSDLAGKSYIPEETYDGSARLDRSSSSSSSSASSTYSHESLSPEDAHAEGNIPSPQSTVAAPHRRRPSTNREASDNRHVAVVPVDTPPTSLSSGQSNSSLSPLTPSSTIFSRRRRGIDKQEITLISPPHAGSSPAHHVAPLSAPIVGSMAASGVSSGSSSHSLVNHQRSMSEAVPPTGAKGVHRKTSSRDIGIVGTRRGDSSAVPRVEPVPAPTLSPPIFQTPQSRSPSPGAPHHSPLPLQEDTPPSSAHSNVTIMPMIGEKAYSSSPTTILPSASTPAVGMTEHTASASMSSPLSTSSFSATQPSSYLYYEPGVHSTAGPLPPPPRAMFEIDFKTPPPPRPPRLRSPSPAQPRSVHEAVTSPSSVSALLQSKSSTYSLKTAEPEIVHERLPSTTSHSPEILTSVQTSTTVHVREGAFPPSAILVTPPMPSTTPADSIQERVESLPNDPKSATPSHDGHSDHEATETHVSVRRLGSELRRESSWNSIGAKMPDGTRVLLDSNSRPSSELDSTPPLQRSLGGSSLSIGEASPKIKGTLTSLKRFSSLPRTPSVADSLPPSSVSSHPPSPLVPSVRPRKYSPWPDAMWYKDVLIRKTALDRATGYAMKINELAMYDCGLGDWIRETKSKANSRGNSRSSPANGQSTNSARPMSLQPRHVSNGSIASQATFPRRPDAYVATDLSPRATDTLPPHYVPPPALPYPSLAPATSVGNGHRLSAISPASVRNMPFASSKSGGFFSSIGRNYSLKKEKDRNGSLPPKVLVKAPPSNSNPGPRPVQIVSAPSVPGGPRAAPGRLQRSQTLMLAPADTSQIAKARRRSNTLKRPSLFGRTGASTDTEVVEDAEFTRQVDKLSDLLPHADRVVLAGYLRRAGQDILAIGQYLEDERNGTIRSS